MGRCYAVLLTMTVVLGCSVPTQPVAPRPTARASGATGAREIVDLGTLGGSWSMATGITGRGQVIGRSAVPGSHDVHGFVWCDGRMRDVGILGEEPPGSSVFPLDYNERGQIVGYNSYGLNHVRAFLWRRGVLRDLGALRPGGFSQVVANAISPAGHVVGQSDAVPSGRHAFLWQDGAMTDLGTLRGEASVAWDVNSSGQVVGWSDGRAFLWEEGAMQDLGPVLEGGGGALKINEAGQVTGSSGTQVFFWSHGERQDIGPSGAATSPVAINDRGQVALNADGDAFVWDAGVLTPLGSLAGGRTTASAMNNQTQIVGSSAVAPSEDHAFVWENGAMSDLGTLGGTQSAAVAINSGGDVAGWALDASQESHAVLWRRAQAQSDLARGH
jgi:probable HAF family extracellular repeat protein